MSDAKTPESAVPAPATPADPVVVTEAPVTETSAEHVVVEREADPVVADRATTAPVVAVERKRRGVGAWSFVLGLLTAIVDIAFVVFVVVVLVGAVGDLSAGTFEGASTALAAAGLVLLALFILFSGFLSAGVAALLGLIALVTGRGRVLGLFGLIFGVAAILVRVLLLSGGLISPDLG